MKRREFIAGLSAATVAVGMPFGARAQQAMPVIGFLNSASPVPFAHLVAGFSRGLRKQDLLKVRISQSSTAGRKGIMIGCPHWWPN